LRPFFSGWQATLSHMNYTQGFSRGGAQYCKYVTTFSYAEVDNGTKLNIFFSFATITVFVDSAFLIVTVVVASLKTRRKSVNCASEVLNEKNRRQLL
jgi:uncharacterized membrane protein